MGLNNQHNKQFSDISLGGRTQAGEQRMKDSRLWDDHESQESNVSDRMVIGDR